MFGLGNDSYEDVEDVVVEDADDLVLSNPQDVFVERRAVAGECRIESVGDVYLTDSNDDLADPYRDCVVSGGDDTRIETCEDVLITRGAVDGDLVIEKTRGDVFTAVTDAVTLDAVDDVYLQGGISHGDSVRVERAEDVRIESDARVPAVTADDTEDVLVAGPSAVADGVDERAYHERAPVHLGDVEDVLVEARAVEGRLVAADPGDVDEDAVL
ncbi:hypothetical protein [Halorientalis pallida]|uniref:Uncharacterized protein n=1 Tax=Halorientalis pallida TaxID=2479928 RepID=A0A498L3P0_9EURY|nr:hypothetical protein [Halorientalis pallida]RXK48635.1 hypothetical protein EAF64_13255 [Halorientalis pallida]